MKKITFFVASVLMASTTINASETTWGFNNTVNCFANEPIAFEERGIAFFVFHNGEFDFNTRPDDTQGTYFFRTAGRRTTTTEARRPINLGVIIEQDSFGRIKRVGNTFINYDHRDRVTRIGTVFMRYNRIGLTQIGGMRLVYNRNGEIIEYIGNIKGWNRPGFVYTTYNDYPYHNGATVHYPSTGNYYYYRPTGVTVASNK
jgi:hypothetical protein